MKYQPLPQSIVSSLSLLKLKDHKTTLQLIEAMLKTSRAHEALFQQEGTLAYDQRAPTPDISPEEMATQMFEAFENLPPDVWLTAVKSLAVVLGEDSVVLGFLVNETLSWDGYKISIGGACFYDDVSDAVAHFDAEGFPGLVPDLPQFAKAVRQRARN